MKCVAQIVANSILRRQNGDKQTNKHSIRSTNNIYINIYYTFQNLKTKCFFVRYIVSAVCMHDEDTVIIIHNKAPILRQLLVVVAQLNMF